MLSRMIGAAMLRSETFEEVEADSGAMAQALIVVILVAIASIVGEYLLGEPNIIRALIFGVVLSVVSWAVWALVAVFVGTKILNTEETEADWGQVSRCTGFAQTPGILSILIFVPYVGGIFGLVSIVLRIAAMVVAIRQSLDYTSTWRAFFVVLISAIPAWIIIGVAWVILTLAL